MYPAFVSINIKQALQRKRRFFFHTPCVCKLWSDTIHLPIDTLDLQILVNEEQQVQNIEDVYSILNLFHVAGF
jgi:hypothetical protein